MLDLDESSLRRSRDDELAPLRCFPHTSQHVRIHSLVIIRLLLCAAQVYQSRWTGWKAEGQ